MASHPVVWLARHGETEWSRDLRHTGRTDIPLTEKGEGQARALEPALAEVDFDLVLSSPLVRARQTCELAGLGEQAELRDALMEWDYGDYEGITSREIHETTPDWQLWRDGCPNGESPEEIGDRVDSVVRELLETGGTIAVFAHGHVLRVLAARWLGLDVACGRFFALGTGTLSRLGWEHESRVIAAWNSPVG